MEPRHEHYFGSIPACTCALGHLLAARAARKRSGGGYVCEEVHVSWHREGGEMAVCSQMGFDSSQAMMGHPL